MTELPSSARIVVIGGGVGGASVAYHLAEAGEQDVIVLERAELTSGSTFHSAGMVGQLRADPTLTRMNTYSVDLYRRLEASGNPVGWTESGSIKVASSRDRLDEIRRQVSWARSFSLPLHEISPAEVAELFPLVDLDGVVGACFLESDGHLDPSQLCYALASLARQAGVRIQQHTRVTGMTVRDGRIRGVQTDRGGIECEVVVNCGGMFAAELARLAGVRIPVVPMQHQYVITEPFRQRGDPRLPSLRDPDLLVYFRQEVDGLLMGGYERNPAPWTATQRSLDAIPPDFNARLLTPDWARFEELARNAQRRVPILADLGVRRMINGPEAFTPDNEFCLGETSVAGLFVAAGFCAHGIAGAGGIGKVLAEWILDGEPSLDVWHMDISRFGRQYRSPSHTLARTVEAYRTYYDVAFPGRQRESARGLRRSPGYEWHRAHGAVFGEKAGWERVDFYESNEPLGATCPQPRGWAARAWSPAIGAEHARTREAAGLFDETSFAKIEVTGAGAADFLEYVCDNRVARRVGDVTYTQALNRRGGIVCDFTVTRRAADTFLIVTGTAFGTHDLSWLRQQARRYAPNVRIADITGRYCCFALWGPRARDILGSITPAALGNTAFPFMTARDITVGDVPALALRVTFVGELGWEIYASTEYGAALWETLWEAGRPHGLVAAGYRAIESMRLEKGYRVWGSDITSETTPYEAGLGFCVKLDKSFEGRDALVAAKTAGMRRRLRVMTLSDPSAQAIGGEPVRIDGGVVGRVTSGGFGYTVGASIAYAYLPVEAGQGTDVQIDLFGEWAGGTVAEDPLFDPAGDRIRAG